MGSNLASSNKLDGNGEKPCLDWFLHPILVQFESLENIGSQMGHTEKQNSD